MGRVYHFSGSGYFPNCINDPEVIAAFQEEIDQGNDPMDVLTLREEIIIQMYFYWVVKEFSVNFSGSDDFDDSFSVSFIISTDQQNEENLVCGKSFTANDEVVIEQGGVTYISPFLRGVLGLPEKIFAGRFRWKYEDPAGRFAIEVGDSYLDVPPEERFFYSLNLGKYNISIPARRTIFVPGGPGKWNNFEFKVTKWFEYDGIWDKETGQLK